VIQEPFQLFTVFTGVVLLAIVLVEKSKIARTLSPVLLILNFSVPFAVCLVLFQVRIADFRKAGPAMLVAFTIACVGTFAGAISAGMLLDSPLQGILGGQSWKIAGPYVGTYIGGSLNFFALWTGLDIGNPDLFAAANAVDNLTVLPIFLFWILVPERVLRFFPVSNIWKNPGDDSEVDAGPPEPVRLKPLDIAALVFAALAVILVSDWIKSALIAKYMPQFPTILIVTTLALVLAQFRFISRLQGAREIGNLSFYIFFAAVGAMINVLKAVSLAPILFIYVMIILVLHTATVLIIGRFCRMDVRLLAIGSVAAKCGPPTVMALANVKGWKKLVLPGVAAGLLGYAVGNYFGFGAAYLMKFLLGQ